MNVRILFYIMPLSVPYEEVQKVLLSDKVLNEIIIHYSEELLKQKQIETFQIEKNLAITEAGYIMAVPEDRLIEIEKPTST